MTKNKQRALDYMQAVFTEKDMAKVETFFGNDWTQHNPSVKNGIQALRDVLTDNDMQWEPSIVME
ncbi:hypothetical protein [Lactiplantibacillus mudanjiangensis]|uniref:SnoaL-like domain-containing protein n=1 Tax=Lactiplantibacillus mudanjiangensis TaxID=1296538 RepID=A0A660DUN1_9LACO|nr:hypothetical protein [Lactiplantibacillus mudanjiangensis]VDG20273.1 hypothetical protein MUDAN_BIHEEGNE_01891 [Lactiplantibacillus mudanjiangensis]VDG24037.1 hypothetical protein MUDAN_IGPPGNFN_00654 [Lactiplantibacillus mudanjiangensis]VDG27281.1 hypothetical protein MUDAN_MDHGFNIF_02191 [Lactiplantibacillus mudanjiangensis]